MVIFHTHFYICKVHILKIDTFRLKNMDIFTITQMAISKIVHLDQIQFFEIKLLELATLTVDQFVSVPYTYKCFYSSTRSKKS